MNRKEFLKKSTKLGVCCGAAALLPAGSLFGQEQQAPAAAEPPRAPCEKRVSQGQAVIKRIVAQMDAKLDHATARQIMETCGEICHNGAHGKPAEPPSPERVKGFLGWITKNFGPEAIKYEGDETVILFKYLQNPQGLKVADGYCLCPIMEDAPKDVSRTYCYCSVGYVREIFQQNLGKPAKVELTNSVLWGGKSCDFTVRVQGKV